MKSLRKTDRKLPSMQTNEERRNTKKRETHNGVTSLLVMGLITERIQIVFFSIELPSLTF